MRIMVQLVDLNSQEPTLRQELEVKDSQFIAVATRFTSEAIGIPPYLDFDIKQRNFDGSTYLLAEQSKNQPGYGRGTEHQFLVVSDREFCIVVDEMRRGSKFATKDAEYRYWISSSYHLADYPKLFKLPIRWALAAHLVREAA